MRIPLRSLYLGIRMQKIEMCQDYEGYIVQAATVKGGVIVSNDQFRDLIDESKRMRETIEKRLPISKH